MDRTTSTVQWPKTRTGRLVFKSTDQAIMAAFGYYNQPDFVHYLEKEVIRLHEILRKALISRRVNLRKTCHLAARAGSNRQCLHKALTTRRNEEIARLKEDYINGNSA